MLFFFDMFHSAVMTAFQIQAISQDPVTRYLFFWSLFCALFSLLFGYILILQFDTMRTPFKAFEWAFVGFLLYCDPERRICSYIFIGEQKRATTCFMERLGYVVHASSLVYLVRYQIF